MNRTRLVFIAIIAVAVIGAVVIMKSAPHLSPQGNTPSQSNSSGFKPMV